MQVISLTTLITHTPFCAPRFARVDAAQGSPPEDLAVHPMLMNVGRRPTFRDEGEPPLSVEASIQHRFAHDFYGCHMRVVALGFLR